MSVLTDAARDTLLDLVQLQTSMLAGDRRAHVQFPRCAGDEEEAGGEASL